MNYAIICGSLPPTYCGIGQLMPKFIRILQERGDKVFYLTDTEQPEYAPDNADLPPDVTVVRGPVRTGLGWRKVYEFVRETQPEIVLIQYQTFARNYGDGFFPWVVQLAAPRAKIVSMIHEFAGYTRQGRLRQVPALLGSDRLLFSDASQLRTSLPYTRALHEAKSSVLVFGHTSGTSVEPFRSEFVSKQPLTLAYHGFIQPAKGLLPLLEALARFKTPYRFHILGALEPLLDYGTADEVVAYQRTIQNFLDKHPQVARQTVLHGDISPSSTEFREILSAVELALFPFQDGLTGRRSSFLNTLMNSHALLAGNRTPETDTHLHSILDCGGTREQILEFLRTYATWGSLEKQRVYEEQLVLRRSLSTARLAETIYRQLTASPRER